MVRTGPHSCLVIDADPHPTGDVRLRREPDGWTARVMTLEQWYVWADVRRAQPYLPARTGFVVTSVCTVAFA